MGNYITSALLEERIGTTLFGQLINITDSSAKAAAIANIIERSEAVVDGYLGVVYSVPVSANALVEEWAMRLAEYEAYKRSPWEDVPTKIKDSYDDAIEQLKDVAAGRMSLPITVTASDGSEFPDIEIETTRYESTYMGSF
jgi:phage gp36-like protein